MKYSRAWQGVQSTSTPNSKLQGIPRGEQLRGRTVPCRSVHILEVEEGNTVLLVEIYTGGDALLRYYRLIPQDPSADSGKSEWRTHCWRQRHAEQTEKIRNLLQKYTESQVPISPSVEAQEIQAEQFEDDGDDSYSLAAAANFMFGKMLLETKYSLGGKVQQFLEKCRPKMVSRRDIKWLEEMKDQISGDMLRGFNCSRKQLDGILPYCRHVVEEFLYSRVYSNIYENSVQGVPLEPEYEDFERTTSQIVRFAKCPIPGLQNILIGRILEAMDFEYALQCTTCTTQNDRLISEHCWADSLIYNAFHTCSKDCDFSTITRNSMVGQNCYSSSKYPC